MGTGVASVVSPKLMVVIPDGGIPPRGGQLPEPAAPPTAVPAPTDTAPTDTANAATANADTVSKARVPSAAAASRQPTSAMAASPHRGCRMFAPPVIALPG